MRHRPDQFSVLKDRTAAHPLNDSSGFFKQFFIRHPDHHSFIDLCSFLIHLHHFNVKFPDFIFQKTPHLCRSCHDFLFSKKLLGFIQSAINPCIGIFFDRSKQIIAVIDDHSFHCSRISTASFYHILNRCPVKLSSGNFHQSICIRIMNPMSQSSELILFCQKCNRSKTLYIIPHPDSQLIFTGRGLHCLQSDLYQFSPSPYCQFHLLTGKLFQFFQQFFFSTDFFLIDCFDIVSAFHHSLCRFVHFPIDSFYLLRIKNQYSVRFHINSCRHTSHRYFFRLHCFRLCLGFPAFREIFCRRTSDGKAQSHSQKKTAHHSHPSGKFLFYRLVF